MSFIKIFSLIAFIGTILSFSLMNHSHLAWADVFQFVNASIELTTSEPEATSDWLITIKTVQEIPPSGKIKITPQADSFTVPVDLSYTDIDLQIAAVDIPLSVTAGTTASSSWGVNINPGLSGSIVLQNNSVDTIQADAIIIIKIGKNAQYEFAGGSQIQNPFKLADSGVADIHTIEVSSLDSGNNMIDTIALVTAIIESTTSSGSQSPDISFSIEVIQSPSTGQAVASSISWGQILPASPQIATLRVKVNTNAQAGFYVYVKQEGPMKNTLNENYIIDEIPASNQVPQNWQSPTGNVLTIDTAYLGYTTSDDTLNDVGDGPARFAGGTKFAGLTLDQEPVLYHSGPSQSNIEGQDYADITFKLETNNIHPTGNYKNNIIFTTKAVF